MSRPKIKNLKELKNIINRLKYRGKKIVFTNGCFDILHYGHIKYLEDAKKKGDILVVGVNSDSSIKRIKGAARPIVNQRDRLRIIAALEKERIAPVAVNGKLQILLRKLLLPFKLYYIFFLPYDLPFH